MHSITKFNVILSKLNSDGSLTAIGNEKQYFNLELLNQVPESVLLFNDVDNKLIFKYSITKDVEYAKYAGNNRLLLNTESDSLIVEFKTSLQLNEFSAKLKDIKFGRISSKFDERTEESSSTQYFQFYAYLSQQQNMMQDYIRTCTYQRAIYDNFAEFKDKIVLDVGAGSGILSFFAAQSGASKVYAIEASSMAQHATTLVKSNKMDHIIKVIAGKIEEIEIPEKVDIIISEPMGYMLFNERMLESFLHAKKFLKQNGNMYPRKGNLYVAPFNDEALHQEQINKANFWTNNCFYGIDLASLKQTAYDEYFKQPIVDTFDKRICLADPVSYSVDFLTANESDLYNMHIDLTYNIKTPCIIHGLAFWFDVAFIGSQFSVLLTTAPDQPLTHWYQVRCLFPQPYLINQPKTITGYVNLKANKKQSYDVEICLTEEGSNRVYYNLLDLKNPYFRYTGQALSVPVGQNYDIAADQYGQIDNGNQMIENYEQQASKNGQSNLIFNTQSQQQQQQTTMVHINK